MAPFDIIHENIPPPQISITTQSFQINTKIVNLRCPVSAKNPWKINTCEKKLIFKEVAGFQACNLTKNELLLTHWILRFLPTQCNWGEGGDQRIEQSAFGNDRQCVTKIHHRVGCNCLVYCLDDPKQIFFDFSEKCTTASLLRVFL